MRHEVLPLLGDVVGRDVAALTSRTASLLRDDAAYLSLLAEQIDPTDAKALAAAPPARSPSGASMVDHGPAALSAGRCRGRAGAGRCARVGPRHRGGRGTAGQRAQGRLRLESSRAGSSRVEPSRVEQVGEPLLP